MIIWYSDSLFGPPSKSLHGNTGRHSHRRTQDFTMEGVHVVRAGPGGMGDESPPVGPGTKPRWGSGGRSPPDAKANCEICVQFFRFSCRKFRI